jgi:hypothetical protein
MSRENSAMQRFTRVGFSTTDPSKLIYGYLNEPLVSLEEALKPFYGKIDQLPNYIKEAKTNCHYPSKHKLTRDESAAIYIYTMNWGQGNVYDRLQAAWSSNDRSQLKPWFSYLRLLKSALDKLPIAKTKIWQGIPYRADLKDQLTSKAAALYSCMGSGSPSMNEIKDHLQKHSSAKIILVGYESVDGRDVTGYTAGSSKEVIVPPGMQLNVAKWVMDGMVVTGYTAGSSKEVTVSPDVNLNIAKLIVDGKAYANYTYGSSKEFIMTPDMKLNLAKWAENNADGSLIFHVRGVSGEY